MITFMFIVLFFTLMGFPILYVTHIRAIRKDDELSRERQEIIKEFCKQRAIKIEKNIEANDRTLALLKKRGD